MKSKQLNSELEKAAGFIGCSLQHMLSSFNLSFKGDYDDRDRQRISHCSADLFLRLKSLEEQLDRLSSSQMLQEWSTLFGMNPDQVAAMLALEEGELEQENEGFVRNSLFYSISRTCPVLERLMYQF